MTQKIAREYAKSSSEERTNNAKDGNGSRRQTMEEITTLVMCVVSCAVLCVL